MSKTQRIAGLKPGLVATMRSPSRQAQTAMDRLGSIKHRYDRVIWSRDPQDLPAVKRIPLRLARIVVALIGDFRDGEITLRAMSLVYTTLVSLVPLLALAFSLLKAFGADNALRPTLARFLAPLGPGSGAIVDKIVDFVANVQVGVLGAIGVVALIYSVLSLIQKVEAGCNFIWRVREPRSLGRRITEYISVLVVGPLVILAAASLTASVSKNETVVYLSQFEGVGMFLYGVGRLLPYVLYSAAFTALFKLIPNTRVHLSAALGGGIFAGVLWQTASTGFALFAKNAGNVNAIYSSFAIIILLLIWLYVSWMILLLGCRVAFWIQHPERLMPGEYPPRLGSREAERLVLRIAVEVARRFAAGEPATDISDLSAQLRTAPDHVHRAVERLVVADVLIEAERRASTHALVPARDIGRIRVADILAIVTAGDASARLAAPRQAPGQALDVLLARAESARAATIGDTTLRDLVDSTEQSVEKTKPSGLSTGQKM